MAGPVVTISRQHGSGGEEVAALVAQRLRVPVLDKELRRRAAERAGVSERAIDQAERSASFVSRMLERLGSVGMLADGGAVEAPTAAQVPTSDSYRSVLEEVVREAAENGAVIIGHAAQITLRDMPGVLRVLVQAPVDARVAHVAREERISPQEARRAVEREDRDRIRFYQTTYHTNWYDARLYDCVVDTHLLGVHGAADMIVAMAERVCLAPQEPAAPVEQPPVPEEVTTVRAEEGELVELGSSTVRLRPMSGQDGPELLSLFRSLPPEDLLYLRQDATNPHVLDAWARDVADGHMLTVLAEIDRSDGLPEVVGEASLLRSEVPWTSHVGEVRVTTSSAHRMRGLGSALLTEVLRAARDAGIEKVTAQMTAEQTGARRLFERLGFKQEGYYEGHARDQSGRPHDLVVMTYTRTD